MPDITSILNPNCHRCREPLPRLSAEELRATMTKQHIPIQPIESWNLSYPRYAGWWLEFIFHGRREPTSVIRCAVRLDGTKNYPHEDRTPAAVTDIERPEAWRGSKMDYIPGVWGHPRRGVTDGGIYVATCFEVNIVRVGSFLAFGDREGSSVAMIQLPIAHLAAWFRNEQIEKW